jgi:hypothetical protein
MVDCFSLKIFVASNLKFGFQMELISSASFLPLDSRNILPRILQFAIEMFRSAGVDVMITIFCEFCQFSAKILAFFSKANVVIKFLQKLAVV